MKAEDGIIDDELELIRAAQNGDLNAMEALIERHDRQVWRIALTMAGDEQDAQEIYQETFTRAWRKIGSFRFQSQFSTWVIRIAVNLCINYRRKRWRRVLLTGHSIERACPDRDPEHALLNRELEEQIGKAMESLPSGQLAVFSLKMIHGYKISEIARIMRCAEGTVKNSLFRATRKMREKLTPYLCENAGDS